MKEESPGRFLNGFGIFGPSLIQLRSFRTQLLRLQDLEIRFAQTTSTAVLVVCAKQTWRALRRLLLLNYWTFLLATLV